MKKIGTLLFLIISVTGISQDYSSFTQTIKNLFKAGAISDSTVRTGELDKQWAVIKSHGIPITKGDSVAFLFRGTAKSVNWMGDFNGWGSKKDFDSQGKRIPGTDIWLLRSSFPKDARLDYKVVVGETWKLDPENRRIQWSGNGSSNSVLRMPMWKEDPRQKLRVEVPPGIIEKDQRYESNILGYQIKYSVYLPVGYKSLGKRPVLYVTDGDEYLSTELGNMNTVVDNLIADKKIEPIIIVFVEHRDPANPKNNRRMQEMSMNAPYLKFFSDEFIPMIEAKYPIQTEASHRGIMGTSLGGLTAAYFTFSRPDLFGLAGIQSPAFWYRPKIFTLYDSLKGAKANISMTSGVILDTSEGARKMKEVLQNNGFPYHYRETNESHSWGNWRNLLSDILIDLYGKH